MKSINDGKIIDFDYLIAKDHRELHYDIQQKEFIEEKFIKGLNSLIDKARWRTAALFQLNQQRIITLFGFPLEEATQKFHHHK